MKFKKRLLTLPMLLLGMGLAVSARQSDAVVWMDYDTKSIPEPKERTVSLGESFFDSHMSERWKRAADLPRWVRLATRTPKQASNVNALDEVPDSSWYTNRHALRHMTTEALVRGPNRGGAPDFTHATITRAKRDGVTPGLFLKDNKGDSYLIKFDNKDYPELQSGAEVISTKILYAAGYNVPENYIGFLDPASLEIAPDVELDKRPFTREALSNMLKNAAQRPDGRYRVLASKILKGVGKGPFTFIGLRADDPNDIIPHEHRRELRGLRVIASWINHWDMKEQNSLDMYVEEGGRKFLRHFLIDFGSSLGGGKSPMEYFHGREYVFDTGNITKELFSLGVYLTPDEKSAPLVLPEVGIFSATDFKPGDWEPSFRVMPFDNMTQEDAFWASRIILSFTEDDLRAIVKTAEYTNPQATDYILKTLVERRQMIARYWFRDGSAIANFSLETGTDGVALKFDDLMAEHDLAGNAEYQYEITSGDRRSEKTATSVRLIPLGEAIAAETKVKIWTTRGRTSFQPVTVVVNNKNGGGYGLLRIERS